MPTQEEGEYHASPASPVVVRVCLAPRNQPFDECMDSLNVAIQMAQVAGFRLVVEKVRKGCPGFQNLGPILAHFLASRDTHLFIAADDIVCPPDTIVRLVNDNKDIVSGIYRKNVIQRLEPANKVNSAEEFLEKYKQGGVYETEYGACHTMTIKREVIEKMVKDYPELEYDDQCGSNEVHYGLFFPIIKDRKVYQDDWAFSIRAKQSGFKIWDDFGCRLKHWCGDFLGFEGIENMEAKNT